MPQASNISRNKNESGKIFDPIRGRTLPIAIIVAIDIRTLRVQLYAEIKKALKGLK